MQNLSFGEFLRQSGGGISDIRPVSSPVVPTEQPKKQGAVSQAFQAGVSKVKQGIDQARPSQGGIGGLVQGVGKILGGATEAITSPLAPIFSPVGKAIDYATQPISDNPNVQDFAASDAGLKTIRGAETISDYANAAGLIAGGVASPKISGAVTNLAKPATRGTGRALKSLGEKSYGMTITPEDTTSMALQRYQANQPGVLSRAKNTITGETRGKPITEANTAARYGLGGTEWQLGVQAQKASNKIWTDQISPKLKSIKGKVNMKDFFNRIEKEIKKTNPDLNRRNALIEGLSALKEDFKNVGPVSLEKLQDYKSGWAKTLPDSVYKGKPIAGALKEVKNLSASKAREIIYHYVGEKNRQAYIDYGNLQSIAEAGVKSVKDPASRSISRNVWEAVMNKAITPVLTLGGKVLYRTGDGLEFIGNKGAKTVNEVINLPLQELNPKTNPTKLPINIQKSNSYRTMEAKIPKRKKLNVDFNSSGPNKIPINKVDAYRSPLDEQKKPGKPMNDVSVYKIAGQEKPGKKPKK